MFGWGWQISKKFVFAESTMAAPFYLEMLQEFFERRLIANSIISYVVSQKDVELCHYDKMWGYLNELSSN